MKILETKDGKVTAEVDGKYLTRIVFANNTNTIDDYKAPSSAYPLRIASRAQRGK